MFLIDIKKPANDSWGSGIEALQTGTFKVKPTTGKDTLYLVLGT